MPSTHHRGRHRRRPRHSAVGPLTGALAGRLARPATLIAVALLLSGVVAAALVVTAPSIGDPGHRGVGVDAAESTSAVPTPTATTEATPPRQRPPHRP